MGSAIRWSPARPFLGAPRWLAARAIPAWHAACNSGPNWRQAARDARTGDRPELLLGPPPRNEITTKLDRAAKVAVYPHRDAFYLVYYDSGDRMVSYSLFSN